MDPFVNAAMVLADPKGIKPDYSYFPFMATLNKIAAGFEGMALIVCVILLVAAAILFGASKLTSSPAAARSRVLLPVPLRPMRAVSVPGASVAQASVSSVRLP